MLTISSTRYLCIFPLNDNGRMIPPWVELGVLLVISYVLHRVVRLSHFYLFLVQKGACNQQLRRLTPGCTGTDGHRICQEAGPPPVAYPLFWQA